MNTHKLCFETIILKNIKKNSNADFIFFFFFFQLKKKCIWYREQFKLSCAMQQSFKIMVPTRLGIVGA